MKKIYVVVLLILISTGLASCVRQMTYDDLLLQYQQDVNARNDIYQNYIDVYNDLSFEVADSIVKVTKSVLINQSSSIGSGFIFYEDETKYYVLTNYHVINSNEFQVVITITDNLGRNHSAQLVAADPNYDLALLSFFKQDDKLDILKFDRDSLNFRDPIFVVGYPNGQINGITMGELIDVDQIDVDSSGTSTIDFEVLIVDAPVETGSSGSVVLDDSYEIVGVIFAGNFLSNSNTSTFAFAIPTEKILEFFDLYDFTYVEAEVTS
jgi:S1-C subfamily serine protease